MAKTRLIDSSSFSHHNRPTSLHAASTAYSHSNHSQTIIPRTIRTVTCNFFDLSASSLQFDSNEAVLSRSATNYNKKIRQAKSAKENVFLNKAREFLTSIDVTKNELSAQTQLSPSGQENLGEEPTQEGIPQSRIGGKVSYKHLLDPLDFSKYPILDFSDTPDYIMPSPLKDALNLEFQGKNPILDPKLTLSKILNLREDLIFKLCKDLDMEACTISIAWTYYSRFLRMNLVTKINRKLYAAVCVILAYKFNEETHLDGAKEQLNLLIKAITAMDKHDNLSVKDIMDTEFTVYSHLGFNLLIPLEEFQSNFLYTLNRLEISPQEYLGNSLGIIFLNEWDYK